MTTATKTLSPTVTDCGFWQALDYRAATAWPLAMSAVANATGGSQAATRDFLESKLGRVFGLDVEMNCDLGLSLGDAVAKVTSIWMGWTEESQHGMPYLKEQVLNQPGLKTSPAN